MVTVYLVRLLLLLRLVVVLVLFLLGLLVLLPFLIGLQLLHHVLEPLVHEEIERPFRPGAVQAYKRKRCVNRRTLVPDQFLTMSLML